MNDQPSSGSAIAKGSGLNSILSTYWPLIALGALFVLSLCPVLGDWWATWEDKQGYYSHGLLVPLIAAYMIYSRRHLLKRIPFQPSYLGLILLIGAVPTYVLAVLLQSQLFWTISFFALLYGAVLTITGTRFTRVLLVPIFFLITMIPVGTWILDNQTGSAQLHSATIAAKLLELSGYHVSQMGNTINSESLPEPLLVGMPCSGLRLLVSLITFSWFFVYVVTAPTWKKIFIFFLSLPLSLFINSLRITMIGYSGFWTGSAQTMHTFHDYSGYISLVVCFVLLFGIARLMKVREFGASAEPDDAAPAISKRRVPMVPTAVAGAIILTLACIGLTVKPLYTSQKGHLNRNNIPLNIGSWNGEVLTVDPVSVKLLNKGDLYSLLYTDSISGRRVQVFLDASIDLMAFHDPHLCLPGSGSPITGDQMITIKFDKPKPMSVKATALQASSEYGSSLVVYWYMYGDKSVPRTDDLADVNRADRMGDLKQIIMNPGSSSQIRKNIAERQFVWYRFSTEIYADQKTDLKFMESFIRQFIGSIKDVSK